MDTFDALIRAYANALARISDSDKAEAQAAILGFEVCNEITACLQAYADHCARVGTAWSEQGALHTLAGLIEGAPEDCCEAFWRLV